MFLLQQMLPAVAIAAAVSTVISALALTCGSARMRGALAAFATAVGYGCGHLFISGWVGIPPPDTTHWLPVFALVAAVVGAGLSWVPQAPARFLIAGLISVAAMRLLLQPKFRHAWPAGEGWLWVAALGGAATLLVWSFQKLANRCPSRVETLGLALIVCVSTTGTLTLSGSFLLGGLAMVLTAALGGLLVLSFRGPALTEAPILVLSLVLGALIVSGKFFAELPGPVAALLVAASVLASLSGRSVVRVTLTLALAGAALWISWLASPPLL